MSQIHGKVSFRFYYQRQKFTILSFNLQKIRDNREKFSKLRTIFINNTKPDDYDGDEMLPYANNEMITSKVS